MIPEQGSISPQWQSQYRQRLSKNSPNTVQYNPNTVTIQTKTDRIRTKIVIQANTGTIHQKFLSIAYFSFPIRLHCKHNKIHQLSFQPVFKIWFKKRLLLPTTNLYLNFGIVLTSEQWSIKKRQTVQFKLKAREATSVNGKIKQLLLL